MWDKHAWNQFQRRVCVQLPENSLLLLKQPHINQTEVIDLSLLRVTHFTFDPHAFLVLFFRVGEDDVRQVKSGNEAFNVVGDFDVHAVLLQALHRALETHNTHV